MTPDEWRALLKEVESLKVRPPASTPLNYRIMKAMAHPSLLFTPLHVIEDALYIIPENWKPVSLHWPIRSSPCQFVLTRNWKDKPSFAKTIRTRRRQSDLVTGGGASWSWPAVAITEAAIRAKMRDEGVTIRGR